REASWRSLLLASPPGRGGSGTNPVFLTGASIHDGDITMANGREASSVQRIRLTAKEREEVTADWARLVARAGSLERNITGWVFKYAKKNFWRVESYYELDDLVQDGFMIYCAVREHYSDITDKPHLMALFKRAFSNHIHDLSTKRTRKHEMPAS